MPQSSLDGYSFLSRNIACDDCGNSVKETGPETGYTIRNHKGESSSYLCYKCGQLRLHVPDSAANS